MKCRLLHAVLFLLISAGQGQGTELRLAAAASMTDCIKEITGVYQKTNPELEIILQFAASGSLAKQIINGAPFDLYISANEKWMDHLLEKKLIVVDSLIHLARNRLVFVSTPDRDIAGLSDLSNVGLIAMGSPRSVPAGQYTAQALDKAGMLRALEENRKIIYAKDVRQALRYAELKEVDGAFVYQTDAIGSVKVTTKFIIARDMHDPIVYPAGITLKGNENSEALRFMDFLKQDKIKWILTKYGFENF